jgi:Lrp/AsnC family transcriptional regulator for asnA, asnC and gidA
MGFTTMAHIGVKAEVSRLQEIADQIASFEEVIYLVFLTGSYDLHIEVVCRDQTHLLDFLTNKLHSVEGIKDTETFICMRIAKEVYTWSGYLEGKQKLEVTDKN